MSRYYPVHLNLVGRRCVIIGGGAVAERKALGLLEAGAAVRVVSPDSTETLRNLAENSAMELVPERYQAEHLDGAFLVFIATNDAAVNEQAAADAAARGLLVNRADEAEAGDFLVPAVVRRGDLTVSIATGGSNPSLTAHLVRELEVRFPEEYGAYVELMRQMRGYRKAEGGEANHRAAMRRLLSAENELLGLLKNAGFDAALARAQKLVSESGGRQE